jgi:hypothetical protein
LVQGGEPGDAVHADSEGFQQMRNLLSRLIPKTAAFSGRASKLHCTENNVGTPGVAEGPSLASGLTRLLGGVDEPLFVIDDCGRLAGASAPFLQLLEASEKDVLGRFASDFLGETAGVIEQGAAGSVRITSAVGISYSAQLRIMRIDASSERAFRVGFLSQVRLGERGPAQKPNPAAAARQTRDATRFNGALRTRLRNVPPPHLLTAGRIGMISLEEVKAALGPQWPAQAEKAKAIARSILTQRLAPEDMFAEAEDDCFVVCFATLDVSQGRVKAELIAREIRERLVGVSPHAFTIVSQVDRIEVDQTEMAEKNPLSSLVRQLDAAHTQRQQVLALGMTELLANGKLHLSPVFGSMLRSTGVSVARLGGQNLALLSRTEAGDPNLVFKLDAMLLGLVLKHLYEQLSAGNAPAIIVPVHYPTLSDKKYAPDYITLCNRMHPSVRGRVIFELKGTPQDVPPLRLEEILCGIAPFSAHRILRTPNLTHKFIDLSRYRLAMLSIGANPSHKADPQGAPAFQSFVSMVRNNGASSGTTQKNGCKLLVQDVENQECARWYCSNGADFLCLVNSDKTPARSTA